MTQKKPAYNVRFGATAAVTPLKVTCGFARCYPAGTAVKVPPAPSRRDEKRRFF